MATSLDWFGETVTADSVHEPRGAKETGAPTLAFSDAVDMSNPAAVEKAVKTAHAKANADTSAKEGDEAEATGDQVKDARILMMMASVTPEMRDGVQALDANPEARDAYMRAVYLDAPLDPHYATDTLDYFFWRQLLEHARTRGHAIHEKFLSGFSLSPNAANGVGSRAFLGANAHTAFFSHLKASDSAMDAYNEYLAKLKEFQSDDARIEAEQTARTNLEHHLLDVLTPAEYRRLMATRRSVGANYVTERSEAEATEAFSSGQVNARTSVFDQFADEYVTHTRELAAYQASKPQVKLSSHVKKARRLFKTTPWSGARKPRDLRTFPLSELPSPEECDAEPHHALHTTPAMETFAADARARGRALLDLASWKDASLLIAELGYDANKGHSHATWSREKTVRVIEGDRLALHPTRNEIWVARTSTEGDALRAELVLYEARTRAATKKNQNGGKRLHLCASMALPAGSTPLGLDVSDANVVVHLLGGIFVVVPRSPQFGLLDAHAYAVVLPLASCFALNADGRELWVGDEIGFAVGLTLRPPGRGEGKIPPNRPVRWERSVWTGDLERVLQIEARANSVVALTRHGVNAWTVPEHPDEPLLRRPWVTHIPDQLSVSHRGNHVAVLDRLGAVRLLNLNAASGADAVITHETDLLYRFFSNRGSQYVASERGGGSGASRAHIQWTPTGTGYWVVYPSGAALAHVEYLPPFVPES